MLAFALTPIESIKIPASVNYLGLNPFEGCEKLKSVYIMNPDGVNIQTSSVSNERSLFSRCVALKDIYVSWSEGTVEGAEYFWKAPGKDVTIHYDYKETK